MEKTQEQARQEILDLVADYCRTYHINNKKPYKPGDRIPYASRVYDEAEMVNLVDSALEFWLTSGRYTDEFEAKLAEYLGVRYCALVNSGSSANLSDPSLSLFSSRVLFFLICLSMVSTAVSSALLKVESISSLLKSIPVLETVSSSLSAFFS